MTRNTTRVIGVGLAAVGIALAAMYYTTGDQPPLLLRPETLGNAAVPENNPAGSNVYNSSQLQSQVTALQSTIMELQQQLEQVKTERKVAATGEPELALTQKTDHTVNETPAQKQQEVQQIFLQLDTGFAAQSIDRDWSDTARQRIETALNDPQTMGLNIASVDCRSSICKLELSQMDDEDEATFRGSFREQVADIFGAGMVREDESGKTIVFLAKDAGTFESILSTAR